MSAEKLVDVLARRLDRRRVLAKLGMGAVGGLAALAGLPGRAAAGPVDWRCCHLCRQNSGLCSGCSCVWCWGCL